MTIAVRIQDVNKSFGNLRVLTDIDLEIKSGEFFALLGPNGAGKTTLISLLAGLSIPDSGHLSVMGSDVTKDYRSARRKIGIVPQELVFDPFFTVLETLKIQSGYFGVRNNQRWLDEILERLDLKSKAHVNMRNLSGGMKRRVLVAQALVHRPPVIVLDEPTAGVDVELRQGLWEFIKGLNQDGHTILLTTHYLEEAQALCQKVAMLKSGKLVALDSTKNLIKRFPGLRLSFRLKGDKLPNKLSGLANIKKRGSDWLINLPNYRAVENFLKEIRLGGQEIDFMELTEVDLEEVFFAIMQGHTD